MFLNNPLLLDIFVFQIFKHLFIILKRTAFPFQVFVCQIISLGQISRSEIAFQRAHQKGCTMSVPVLGCSPFHLCQFDEEKEMF